MDSYLASRGVTPSGASVTQFQTALAAQIAAASVASAAACTGNAATATQANNALACSGNAATATTATNAIACSGNAATATKLQTARTITISGDATGSTSFDGSGNVTLSLDVTSANTSQACSGNAATVGGVNPVNGNAGTFSDSYVTLSAHGTWVIPNGTYIFTGYANSESGATSGNALQILNTAGSTWFPNAGARGPFQGMIISDGVHFRLYNADPSYICISFYRKIA
jgi:hypothetical protein